MNAATTKRQRFTADDDLCLLREVVGQNPLQDSEKWKVVQRNVKAVTGKEFLIRTLKDHLFLLLELWRKKNEGNEIRSGVEEIYTERDILLQEITDLCKEFNLLSKKPKLSKDKQIIELGRSAREKNALNFLASQTATNVIADVYEDHDYSKNLNIEVDDTVDITSTDHTSMEVLNCSQQEITLETKENLYNLNCSDQESAQPIKQKSNKNQPETDETPHKKVLGPIRNRVNRSGKQRKNAMDYLNKKFEFEQEIKVKELKLEERRLNLDERKITMQEKKLEMELEEMKRKFDLELEKIKIQVTQSNDTQNLICQQQKIIETLLKTTSKA